MTQSKFQCWSVLATMFAAAVLAFLLSKGERYDLAVAGLWFLGCGWNVYAYHHNRWRSALFRAASMNSGQEPGRRTFTYFLTIIAYFVLLAIHVSQRWKQQKYEETDDCAVPPSQQTIPRKFQPRKPPSLWTFDRDFLGQHALIRSVS